jgi:hypothetical protein
MQSQWHRAVNFDIAVPARLYSTQESLEERCGCC